MVVRGGYRARKYGYLGMLTIVGSRTYRIEKPVSARAREVMLLTRLPLPVKQY